MIANKQQKQPSVHRIEVRVQALRSAFGLADHYYMIIDDDMEYHPGMYAQGSILPNGTTKGYHVVDVRTVCQACHDKIILNFNAREDKRVWALFPLLNCESLSMGFSIQTAMMIAIPIAAALLLQSHFVYALIALLFGLALHLAVSKYMFSRTRKSRCVHLR